MRWLAWTLSLFPLIAGAQTALTGRVVDGVNGAPIEFVSVGSVPSGVFTMSRADGSFRTSVPDSIHLDSVRFAILGYESLTLSVQRLADAVRLTPLSYDLPAAEVVREKRVERKLGNRSHHAFFNYALEERRPDDVIEVAQVIELGPLSVPILAVNFFISDTPMDSATFRIGFRGFDGERPTGPLVQRSIVRRVALTHGWLAMDLRKEHISLKGTIALTLELLPEPGAGKRWMSVGIRLGGGRPAFDRRGTFEQWDRMPHRYSINVVAMVPKDEPDQKAEDPDPFQHAVDLRITSRAVGDTFCIAFGLPDHYDAARPGGYPTVYLLDANVYFSDVVDLCRREARKGRLPPAIVVGVGYRDVAAMDTLRERDYTLAPMDSMPGSGGAGHFLSFLQDELVPLVRQRLPVDTARCAIMGHSLGGHLVLSALSIGRHHGLPFNAFLAASPSLDVAHGAVLLALGGLASEGSIEQGNVFVSHGEGEDDADMGHCIELLKQCFRTGVVEKHYPGTEHMGTAMVSFADGLRQLWGKDK
jgi:predicted alpha/beta superfamily hydrolase